MFDHDFGGGGPFTTVVFVPNDCQISACVSFWSKNRVRLGQAFGTMGDSTLVARADGAVARSKSIAPTSSDESPGDGELRLVDAASGQAKRASRSPSQKMTSATIGTPM